MKKESQPHHVDMRGLYLTTWDTSNEASGVCKKIKSQIKVFEQHGVNMELIDLNSIKPITINIIGQQILSLCGINNLNLYKLYDVIKNKLENNNYNFIYIRRSLLDIKSINFYNYIKQNYPHIKLLFEIPTYPYDKEIHLSLKFMHFHDKRLRYRQKDFADRFITYSNDKEIFGVKTINISNGIDYSKFKIRQPVPHCGINVVAVALFAKWHGYDRFLYGMFQQPEIVKEYNIHLYLAGNGRILSAYKKDVRKHKMEEYVHFLGEIHGIELEELYNKADIALDCMGRHRVGVYYNSSLKGKEYCAYGVPIVSGIKTELDSKNDFKYYFRVPADDSIVNMNDIVSFYNNCYKYKTHKEVSEEIRNSTLLWFDFVYAFKPVIDFIKE